MIFFLWCGDVFVVVFLWWFLVVVFLWWCFCGDVFVVVFFVLVFLWWCSGVFVVV